MRRALVVAACLAVPATAAAAAPARWAGLTRVQVERIASLGDRDYTADPADPMTHVAMRRYWHHHEAWVVKWKTSCAGGHVPTIVLWRGPPRKPSSYDFVCRHTRGQHIRCLEPETC